jgi:hypothetical protein
VSDDELTDAWESGQVLPGGVTHEQHLRIAWVLHRRHGAARAQARLLEGTARACARHGVAEKFDAELTRRWSHAIADAIARDGLGGSADEFLAAHPEFTQSRRFQ